MKKSLQRKLTQSTGNQRVLISRQLKDVHLKYSNLLKEHYHKISRKVADIAQIYLNENYRVHIAIGKLKGLNQSVRKGDGKGKLFRGKISQFPYYKLTELITYKC